MVTCVTHSTEQGEDNVKLNKLGRSDLQVSEICLGSMTWGQQNTQQDAFLQLDYALDQGVNFVDTAEMYSVPTHADTYGSTETIIGNWLHERKRRDQIILATKVAGPGHWIPHIRQGKSFFTQENIESALDASLQRLQTDYIDLYQLHWPDRNTNCFGRLGYVPNENEPPFALEHTLEVLSALVAKGKIRHIGLSNESPWGVMKFLQLAKEKGLSEIVSVQNAYSLLNRTFEVGLAEIAHREQIGLLAYSPLAFGVLTGKYLSVGQRALQFGIWKFANNALEASKKGRRSLSDVLEGFSKEFGLDKVFKKKALASREKPSTKPRMSRVSEGVGLTTDLNKQARLTLFEHYTRYSNPQAKAATKRYVGLAKKLGLDPGQMALAFVRQKSFVASTIIGATSPEQLQKNINSTQLTLGEQELLEIEKIHTDQPNPAP